MSRWTDFRNRLVKWLLDAIGWNNPGRGAEIPAEDAAPEPPADAAPWSLCVKASCWNGRNASRRYMNMLSPKMPELTFREYALELAELGCDHCHLFLMNLGDGEYAGYDCSEKAAADLARSRLAYLRGCGFGVVLWLVADDSEALAQKLFADPAKHVSAFVNAGLFAMASCIVLGLEMDEYGTAAQWKKVAAEVAKVWPWPVGVHHTAGKRTYAALGSVVFDQLDPSCTVADIKRSVREITASGREAFGFEYRRGPDRAAAQAALDAGAHGCGNWSDK